MLPKMVKNGVKSEFYCPFFNPNFNDKFIYICSSFLNKTTQLIHLTIDLSRLHKNVNSGKFEQKIWVNLHRYNNRFIIFHP